METFDNWCLLLGEIRQALEPITAACGMVSVTETEATVETAVELLQELDHPDITAFAGDLQEKMPELVAPLEWLEQQLSPVLNTLDADTQALIIWAWQHRQDLHLDLAADFPSALQPIVRAVWDILGLFHRSSSLAESLHSWLRPYLQIHRGMPKWLLPLLQLFCNHHQFERGKRAGSSPLELAGVEDAPSLAALLDHPLHRILQNLVQHAAHTPADHQHLPGPGDKQHRQVHQFLYRGDVGDRGGEDEDTVGEEGVLPPLLDGSHIAVDGVPIVGQIVSPPLLPHEPAVDGISLRGEEYIDAGSQKD
jgi:hypothetical protein